MTWLGNHLAKIIGASAGSVIAILLKITPAHLFEIALFALIGSVVGESVKLLFARLKKKKENNEG